MKTIHFIRANKTKFGGAEVYLSRLVKALDKKNIQYNLVYSIFPKFLPSWLRAFFFNIQLCLTKQDKFYFSLDRITCPDIYRAGDGVHSVFLNVENKSKFNPLHPIYLFLERRCFKNAKRIIVNSNMVKQQIIDTYHINPEKIRLIYNGIQSKVFNHQQSFERLSKEFSLDQNQPIFLYVGSGFQRKGVEQFLQMIAKLNHPEIQAFIVGKEKKIEFYQNLAKTLNVQNQVVFTGSREDVDDFYTVSDIFLFPTHYEPFSNVVLEAMNFNNVVFTTKQNGASEILSDEFVMHDPDDFSVLKKINELLDNEAELLKIQKYNRAKSKEFSIEKNLVETLQVVDEVIN